MATRGAEEAGGDGRETELLDIFWDYRSGGARVSSARDTFEINYPLNHVIMYKLAQHQHWEIGVKSLIFCFPKGKFSAIRHVTPVINVFFNHLAPVAVNDNRSQQLLHRFSLPTFDVEVSAERMFSYQWEPEAPFFQKAITMDSPPTNVVFKLTYGGGAGSLFDLKNVMFSVRLVYRKA